MSARRIYYENDLELEGMRWLAKVVDLGVGLSVRASTNEMLNAYLYIRERKDIYKQKVKMLCNQAMNAAKRKETLICAIMKDRGFWDDYCDKVVDSSEQDILLLRIAIKQELDKAGCKESDLLSRVETARILLAMTTKQYELAIEEAKQKFKRDFFDEFREHYMIHILGLWESMCDILGKGISVNLNTPAVDNAFDAVCKKFGEGKYIDECMKEAENNHPLFSNDIIVKS